MFSSVDQGQSWETSFSYLDWPGSFLNGFGCQSPKMIYMKNVDEILMSYTGYLRGIYRSSSFLTDTITWGSHFNPTGGDCWDLSSTSNGDTVYSAFSSSNHLGGIYRSNDYGESWQLVLQTDSVENPHLIEATDSLLYYVSVNNKFYRSADFGSSWTHTHTFLDDDQLVTQNYASKDIVRKGNAIFVSFDGIGLHMSNDYGDSWGKIDELVEDQLNYMLVVDNKLFVTSQSGLYSTIIGCTDEESINYNNSATLNDGSCIPIIYGCIDSLACNYSLNANSEDGTCEYPEIYDCNQTCINDVDLDGVCDELEILDCVDVLACNYNELATEQLVTISIIADSIILIDNCNYPIECETCSGETDGTGVIISNDIDNDEICDWDEIDGCTDLIACNYNLSATDDDNSCFYAEINYDCEGLCINDIDDDGVCDEIDNCIEIMNTEQEDEDSDGIGDMCDEDYGVGLTEKFYDSSSLLKMIDLFGREQQEHNKGSLLFYIYDNGEVVKKFNP